MSVRNILLALTAVAMLVSLQACDRTIEQVVSADQQPLSCADCHDDSNVITGKQTQWAESNHGMGESYVRGGSSSCAGCHSGNAFTEMLDAGLNPGSVESGDPDPTRQDCRACHKIHDTYTMKDFALRTEAPVDFYAMDGVTFEGGDGNLCVNCHQPRRVIPDPVDGVISGINSHWGPHHGPQSAMLLGVGGAGVSDMISPHYGAVQNTCVGCHMGDNANHTFEAIEDECAKCHVDIDGFDYRGVQTDIATMAEELGALLLAAGLIDQNNEDGHPTVSSAPEDQAVALWNWIYVAHEDQSLGIHNPAYARALLEEGLARMGASARADLNR